MASFSTRKLVYMSFLTALSIILTRILSIRIAIGGVEGIRIGIGGLPAIFTGVIFGPLAGGIVGAVADVLGYIINPMGAYMPHFTFTAFLTGFIPGAVVFYIFRKKRNIWIFLLAVGIGQTVSSVILVPVFLNNLFGIPFEATVIPRIITQAINIPLYSYLMKLLLEYKILRITENIKSIN
uniref:Signal transduction histidine kinase, LytS n=1 Tax=uncultured organism TaxID=155900 RepID=M1PW47_9ZZZZ|nr:conserved hypothetical protein, membrane [uncultured organism]